jgi:thiamine-phosphate pyrophosphorylase
MSEKRNSRARVFAGIDLYPVTGQAFSKGRSTLEIVEAVKAAGCKVFQLREKDLTKREYYELARRAREIATQMLMICNDHLDVALAICADGIHLGDDDLPIAEARDLAPDLIIGASSHSLEQAQNAQRAGADYVNIGPIFQTSTKSKPGPSLGPQAIVEISPSLHIPYTVMGGIKADNIDTVLQAGARRIAVVTAITAAPDPEKAARSLRSQILSRSGRESLESLI